MNFLVSSLEGVSLILCKNTLIFMKFYIDLIVKIAFLFRTVVIILEVLLPTIDDFLEVTGDCIS